MVQAKEFKGSSITHGNGKSNRLDDKITEWLNKNLHIRLMSCQYSTVDKDNSSALILYEVVI